jgi:hypothetical protein
MQKIKKILQYYISGVILINRDNVDETKGIAGP